MYKVFNSLRETREMIVVLLCIMENFLQNDLPGNQ